MAQYKVVSSKLAGMKQGQLIDATDLAGANIQALLEGGHIAEIGSRMFKKDNDKQTKVEE